MSTDEIKEIVSEEDIKEALKEALREWLNEKFATFGRWTFGGFMSVILAGVVYFVLQALGWKLG